MNWIPKIEYTELLTGTPKVITFESPPESDPFNEQYKVSSTVTTSNSGAKQTAFNYIRKEYSLEFIFQSETVKNAVEDFFKNHAVRGGKFNYFPSSDEVDFEEFELDGKNISFSRPIPNGTGDFEYNFRMKFSRLES